MSRWLLLVSIASSIALAASEPRAPKLGDSTMPPPAERESEPAKRLPATVAVCQERSARRCWVAAGEAGCTAEGGQVFRIVIDQPSRADAEGALAQCRAALSAPP
jgi:hypothetical protein